MTRLVAFWIGGSLLLAGAATPVFYVALEAVAEGALPYRRLFNRVAMLAGLVTLWLLRRHLPFDELRAAWRAERGRRARRIAFALPIALVTGAAAIPIVHATTAVGTASLSNGFLVPRVLEALAIGVLVAILEEGFFRGLVFTGLRREWPVPLAIGGSAVVYAFVHFLTPEKSWAWPGFSATVGFDYLRAVLARMIAPGAWTGFTGLFLVGCALAYVFERRGSLALCIGLHAGWVVAAKLGVWYTVPPEGSGWAPGWQRYYLLEQPITWGAVALAAAALTLGRGRLVAREELVVRGVRQVGAPSIREDAERA